MADSISDTRNTARSVTNVTDSPASFSDQGAISGEGGNADHQTCVEQADALLTVRERLERNGSEVELLNTMNKRDSSMPSGIITAEVKMHPGIKHLEKNGAVSFGLEKLLNDPLMTKEAGVSTEKVSWPCVHFASPEQIKELPEKLKSADIRFVSPEQIKKLQEELPESAGIRFESPEHREELWEQLKSDGVHFTSPEQIKELWESLISAGVCLIHCDIAAVKDEAGLLKSVSEALEFPYLSNNWDSLNDWLTDMAWMPAKGYVLTLSDAGNLWENAKDTAQKLVTFWQETSDERWRGENTPFHLVFALQEEVGSG